MLLCFIAALQFSSGERRVRGLLQSFEDCKKKLAISSSSATTVYPSLLSCLMCLQEGTIKTERSMATTSENINGANTNENKDAFDKIYKDSTWSMAGGGSGVGSDPAFAHGAGLVLQLGNSLSLTDEYIPPSPLPPLTGDLTLLLHLVVFKYGLTSLLDAPCGAASNSWMKLVANSLHNNVMPPLD